MLNEVLETLHNYFKDVDYQHDIDCTFTASDTITGDFADTFIVGEYIHIYGSRLNDGVYLISAIDSTTITIDTTVDYVILTEEEISCKLTKCNIPRALLSIIGEIKTFNTQSSDGIVSESQGHRSVSYSNDGSWVSSFRRRLSKYMKVKWC